MNRPRRLRDDPAFRDLTQGALDDEPLALGPHDLDRLRAQIVAGGPPPLAPRWPSLIGISGLTASLVSLALWVTLPSSPVLPSPPTSTPELPMLGVGELRTAVRTVSPGVDPEVQAAPVPVEPSPAPQLQIAEVPPEPVIAPVPVPVAVQPEPITAPPAHGLVVRTPQGDLQAELEDYNLALEASDSARWAEARERYLAYLERWPEGRLLDEARLGLLAALVRSDRPAEAEDLATDLLRDARLAHHTEAIRLLRAEALVQLDLCDEALLAIDDMRRSPRVNAVRSACRRARH